MQKKEATSSVAGGAANINIPQTQTMAVSYARLGWAVLPIWGVRNGHCLCGRANCPSPGKHPILTNGLKGATKDPFNVQCWFDNDEEIGYPGANVAVVAGAISGFFVLDIDGEEGELSLSNLEEKYGKLPATVQERTGGGGRHLLFKIPQNISIKPKVRVMPGLDVRGENSYIVCAPSTHVSGRKYEWIIDPFTHPILEAPRWLVDMLSEKPQPQAQAQVSSTTFQPINAGSKRTDEEWAQMATLLVEGTRNTALYTYAYHLLSHGLGTKEVIAIIGALNQAYGNPPLAVEELATLIKSALTHHTRIISPGGVRYE